MLSGLPPKADLGSALAIVAPRPSINNTVDGPIGFSRRSGPHAARTASESKIASRHLPHGSGDVGLHEGACPVHEVQEGLVIQPRGHRAAAEQEEEGMERGFTAKAVTEPEARRADRGPGQPLPVTDGRGPRCPTGYKEFGSHRGTRLRWYGSLECPSRSGISGARRGSCRAFEGFRSLEFPVADLVTSITYAVTAPDDAPVRCSRRCAQNQSRAAMASLSPHKGRVPG